jgi:hypothetical protein
VNTPEDDHAAGDTNAPRDPYRRSIIGNRVMMHTLLGHANVSAAVQDDRRGERAK